MSTEGETYEGIAEQGPMEQGADMNKHELAQPPEKCDPPWHTVACYTGQNPTYCEDLPLAMLMAAVLKYGEACTGRDWGSATNWYAAVEREAHLLVRDGGAVLTNKLADKDATLAALTEALMFVQKEIPLGHYHGQFGECAPCKLEAALARVRDGGAG